jgi:hypothetical protein
MTALTADTQVPERAGDLISYPVLTGVQIYKGALLMLTTAGFAAPMTAAAGAGFQFIGLADEVSPPTGIGTAGASGTYNVRVRSGGCYQLSLDTTAAQTDCGQPVWGADDQTVTLTTSATAPKVGKIAEVTVGGKVWVQTRRGPGPVSATVDATFGAPEQSVLESLI